MRESGVPTVLVADGSRMDCQLLADTIQHQSHFRVIATATDGEETIAKILECEPDLAVISARLHDSPSAGILAVHRLHESHSRCRTIILLDENQPRLVVEAFRSGARGVLCRTDTASNLLKCIKVVHKGEIWAANEHIESIIVALREAPVPKPARNPAGERLTQREEQVARLVAIGLSNREIAAQQGLSQHTVKNYLFRIFEKLSISSRTELALYILAQGKGPESDSEGPLGSAHKSSA